MDGVADGISRNGLPKCSIKGLPHHLNAQGVKSKYCPAGRVLRLVGRLLRHKNGHRRRSLIVNRQSIQPLAFVSTQDIRPKRAFQSVVQFNIDTQSVPIPAVSDHGKAQVRAMADRPDNACRPLRSTVRRLWDCTAWQTNRTHCNARRGSSGSKFSQPCRDGKVEKLARHQPIWRCAGVGIPQSGSPQQQTAQPRDKGSRIRHRPRYDAPASPPGGPSHRIAHQFRRPPKVRRGPSPKADPPGDVPMHPV